MNIAQPAQVAKNLTRMVIVPVNLLRQRNSYKDWSMDWLKILSFKLQTKYLVAEKSFPSSASWSILMNYSSTCSTKEPMESGWKNSSKNCKIFKTRNGTWLGSKLQISFLIRWELTEIRSSRPSTPRPTTPSPASVDYKDVETPSCRPAGSSSPSTCSSCSSASPFSTGASAWSGNLKYPSCCGPSVPSSSSRPCSSMGTSNTSVSSYSHKFRGDSV